MDALRALLLVALLTHGTVLSAAAPGAGDAHDVDADAARLAAVVDPATRLRVVHPPRAEAALDSSRVVTRIAFGSCNKHDRDQSYWRRIRDRKPDLWVWLGDIVYADTPVFLKCVPLSSCAGWRCGCRLSSRPLSPQPLLTRRVEGHCICRR